MAPAEKSTVATPASPTTKSATTAPSSPSQAPASASSAAKTASQGQDKVNTSSEAKPSSSTAAAHLAVLNESSTAATSSATGATTATGAVGVTDPSAIGILPASHWDGPVNDHDADSTLGSDAASSTASISSSILAYRTANGRTYHAERGNAEYWGCNDEQALESLDIYSHLCFLSNGKKYYNAPLTEDVMNVLDIGTGTGVWAIDFADMHPNCEVIGTDISPTQPSWVPPNLKFEIEDCTQEWTFKENHFDFVHMRLLYGSIADWPALFDQAYRVTAPGGWIESFEASPMTECDDGSIAPDSALKQWGLFFMEAGEKIGRTFRVLHDNVQEENMRRLGLEDIHVKDVKCPCGPWPKDPTMLEMGRTAQATLEQDYEGYLGRIANIARGWTEEQTRIFCAHMRAEFRNPKNHGYFNFRIVYGRKPGGSAASTGMP